MQRPNSSTIAGASVLSIMPLTSSQQQPPEISIIKSCCSSVLPSWISTLCYLHVNSSLLVWLIYSNHYKIETCYWNCHSYKLVFTFDVHSTSLKKIIFLSILFFLSSTLNQIWLGWLLVSWRGPHGSESLGTLKGAIITILIPLW